MAEAYQVLEGADTFTVGEGAVGALLVHGFTGSPQGMTLLGEHLAARGIACVGPRLPGHGTAWQDLGTRRAAEWVETVEAAFHELAERRDEVFLVGLSFGSALILDLAARFSDQVSGVVCLAPFVHTKDPRRFLSPVVRHVIKTLPGVGNDIADPDMREIVYDKIPTRATHEMLVYLKSLRRTLRSVVSPLLIIHSRNDHTAHPSNATLIHDAVSSTDKEIVWLDRSYHVITLDVDREDVFSRTFEFIKERARVAL